MDERVVGLAGLALASGLLLVLAWAIGVLKKVSLVNTYRAHPERYPDAQGLAAWMGYTLGAGGLSLGFCAIAWGARAIDADAAGLWAATTGVAVAVLALRGDARYRRGPGSPPPGRRSR